MTPVEELSQLQLAFDDARLPEMLFRYRARNWPESLSKDEKVRWDCFRKQRMTDPEVGITDKAYGKTLARLMVTPRLDDHQKSILSQLADWPAKIGL